MKLYVTEHARQRYVERVCNGLNTSNNLLKLMMNNIYAAKEVSSQISNDNPRFILHIHEKFLRKGVKVFLHDNVYYIGLPGEGRSLGKTVIVTCYHEGGDRMRMFKESSMSRTEIFIRLKMVKKKLK